MILLLDLKHMAGMQSEELTGIILRRLTRPLRKQKKLRISRLLFVARPLLVRDLLTNLGLMIVMGQHWVKKRWH